MKKVIIYVLYIGSLIICSGTAQAFDSDISRQSLKGLPGLFVSLEDLNPDIVKYTKDQKVPFDKEQIKSLVEKRLQNAGIRILSWRELQRMPGKPVLYICINTHESEKYWYAYDISIAVQQMVKLVNNPAAQCFAATWSLNMTGTVNIMTLNRMQSNIDVLVDRFIIAYKAAQTIRS